MVTKDELMLCKKRGCRTKRHAGGYCRLHWNRLSRYDRLERVNAKHGPGATCQTGCGRPVHARGYCGTHYMRVVKTGDPGPTELISHKNRKSKYKGVACAILKCPNPAKARGWCEMHYQRWHYSGGENGGDPVGRWGAEPRKSLGYLGSDGYFRVLIDGKKRLQHHVVMEEIIGRPLDPHENVHHKNGQRADNRPENLELWMRPQPKGVRAADMVAFVVSHYRDQVLELLSE